MASIHAFKLKTQLHLKNTIIHRFHPSSSLKYVLINKIVLQLFLPSERGLVHSDYGLLWTISRNAVYTFERWDSISQLK